MDIGKNLFFSFFNYYFKGYLLPFFHRINTYLKKRKLIVEGNGSNSRDCLFEETELHLIRFPTDSYDL